MIDIVRKKGKPILCLDFDGVIHRYDSGWKGPRNIPDPVVPGAIDFLIVASRDFHVAVFSSRGHYWFGRRAMKRAIWRWVFEEMFSKKPDDPDTPSHNLARRVHADTWEPWKQACEEAATKVVRQLSFPRHKPPAMVSLDDRAITFEGVFPSVNELRHFKPWNRR